MKDKMEEIESFYNWLEDVFSCGKRFENKINKEIKKWK